MKSIYISVSAILMLALLSSLSSASVIITYPSPLMVNLDKNNTHQMIEFQNQNLSESPSIVLTLSNNLYNIVTLSQSSINLVYMGSIALDLNQNYTAGTYNGELEWRENGVLKGSIPIRVVIESIVIPEPEEGCRLIELPHTTNYRIKQGEKSVGSPIKIKVSTECSTLSMSINEETQMSKPMYLLGQSGDVLPGGEFTFTIGLDGEGAATGVYQNTYLVSGYSGDKVYQKRITLSTIVTIGTNPITNQTFSTLPACTIDSDMNLNSTYNLVCNNENPNIDIDVPYNEYFEGVSLSEADGRFEYKLKPIKIGNTDFLAFFKYKNVIIGAPFRKAIRIFTGGTPLQGTSLLINFYQFGVKKNLEDLANGEVSAIILDESTKNPLQNPSIILNGKQINETFILKSDIPYEMIVSYQGYMAKTLNFTITKKAEITLTMTPSSNFIAGDSLVLTTTPENTSIFVDGKKESSLIYPSAGTHTIDLIFEGYENKQINITVLESAEIISNSTWKKGLQQSFVLSRNASWAVYYSKDEVSYSLLINGNGNIISFIPEKKGTYRIDLDGRVKGTYEIKGMNWNAKWWILPWWAWVLIVIGIFVVIRMFSGESEKPAGSITGFYPKNQSDSGG